MSSAAPIANVGAMLKTHAMSTIEEIRRSKLKELVATYGGGKQSALSAVIGASPSQISQWINASPDSKTGKPRSMDSTTARRIESSLGLAEGWMDMVNSVAESTEIQPYQYLDTTPAFAPIIEWANIDRELFMNNSELSNNRHLPVPESNSADCKWIKVSTDQPRFGIKSGNKIAVRVLKDEKLAQDGELHLYKNLSEKFFLAEHRTTADGFEALLETGSVLDARKHGLKVIAIHMGTWK